MFSRIRFVKLLIAIPSLILATFLIRSIIESIFVDTRVYCRVGTMIYPSKETFSSPVILFENVSRTSLRRNEYKKILYWTKMFESENFYFGDGDVFASCPVRKCIATNVRYRNEVDDDDANEFDALLFHGPDLNVNDLPTNRSRRQIYVFVDLETHVFHPIPNDRVYERFFNWTMTYRRDSTIMRPYGSIVRIEDNAYVPPAIPAQWRNVNEGTITDETIRRINGKTKMIAWFVSNCETSSKRESYAKALNYHLPIDVYGKCGQLECDYVRDSNECFENVERDYYFYLAFENSLCVDYVTEKPFNFLRYDVVPIVYGAADYSTVLPPGSYIDVESFEHPSLLADYLISLRTNHQKYAEFFKWKTYYRVEPNSNRYTLCELCEKLHEPIRRVEIIDDVYEWWTTGQCLREPNYRGVL